MARRYENWPIRFIIRTMNPQGETLVTWILDQMVSNKYDERAWDRLHNQVQDHLNELAESTGCQYLIESWGYRQTVEDNQWRYDITDA